MKLLAKLERCYVDCLWNKYSTGTPERKRYWMRIYIEEQYKQLVVKELSMIFGEGSGKLEDQLNTQIPELHKILPPQMRPFL